MNSPICSAFSVPVEGGLSVHPHLQLTAVEELARVELLERSRRGVGLTAAGRSFVHHARLVLQQLDQMRGELSETQAATVVQYPLETAEVRA